MKSPMELRQEMINRVSGCILQERPKTHGDADRSFTQIADIMNVLRRGKESEPWTAFDVARFHIVEKMVRGTYCPEHIDNWVDGAGYNLLGGVIAMSQEKTKLGSADVENAIAERMGDYLSSLNQKAGPSPRQIQPIVGT